MTLTVLIGWDPDKFPWPCDDHLEPWELYLYALIYLQYSVIMNGSIPSADMYNAKNEKLRFPKVNHAHVHMLEPVVQLLRHHSVLFSDAIAGCTVHSECQAVFLSLSTGSPHESNRAKR
jgi:hypothetical protein